MKKQIVLALASVLILFSFKSNAQGETAFEKGTVVATIGYGFPDLYRSTLKVAYNGYKSKTVFGLGPIILKGDYGIYKFKWGHTVGAGIVLGYNSTTIKFDYSHYNKGQGTYMDYTETDVYRTITVGARGSYHFFTKEKFDCYASIGIGFNVNSAVQTTDNPDGANIVVSKRSGMYESFTVGIRYYFTKNFGVYSELGWDNSTPIQAGFALKF